MRESFDMDSYIENDFITEETFNKFIRTPDASRVIVHDSPRLFNNIIYIAKQLTDIPGDIVEAGVWRGIMITFMSIVFDDRILWACDSFEGCPDDISQIRYKETWNSENTQIHRRDCKADESFLMNNLESFQVPEKERIKLLKGWFKDTLPPEICPIERIALLRCDSDLYSSTYETLEYLYPKVSPGGFVIFDDYCIEEARTATMKYFDVTNQAVEWYKSTQIEYLGTFTSSPAVPRDQGIFIRKPLE